MSNPPESFVIRLTPEQQRELEQQGRESRRRLLLDGIRMQIHDYCETTIAHYGGSLTPADQSMWQAMQLGARQTVIDPLRRYGIIVSGTFFLMVNTKGRLSVEIDVVLPEDLHESSLVSDLERRVAALENRTPPRPESF